MGESDDRKENVIELEPKGSIRWNIVISLVVAWCVVLFCVLVFKMSLVRMLLPLILFILVVYLGFCTFVFLKNRK